MVYILLLVIVRLFMQQLYISKSRAGRREGKLGRGRGGAGEGTYKDQRVIVDLVLPLLIIYLLILLFKKQETKREEKERSSQ